MSQRKNLDKSSQQNINPQLASTIVHKPFATGKINIFNPPRKNPNGSQITSKLGMSAVLEKPENIAAPAEDWNYNPTTNRHWLHNIVNPWGITAIAILVAVNLVASAVIWERIQQNNQEITQDSETPAIGHNDLNDREFIPLNLSTLSSISTKITELPATADNPEKITPDAPIHPGLASLNSLNSLPGNSAYHYVLTEYTGDRSLKLAREKVDNISLVNFPQGVFIYLGGFTQKSQATAFIEQLRQEGLNAYLYPFD